MAAPSSGSGVLQSLTTNTFFASPTVRNDLNSYYLRIQIQEPVRFRAAVIEYTITEPY